MSDEETVRISPRAWNQTGTAQKYHTRNCQFVTEDTEKSQKTTLSVVGLSCASFATRTPRQRNPGQTAAGPSAGQSQTVKCRYELERRLPQGKARIGVDVG